MLANTGTPMQSSRVMSVTREIPRPRASDRARSSVTSRDSARRLELSRNCCDTRYLFFDAEPYRLVFDFDDFDLDLLPPPAACSTSGNSLSITAPEATRPLRRISPRRAAESESIATRAALAPA